MNKVFYYIVSISIISFFAFLSCREEEKDPNVQGVFLKHSGCMDEPTESDELMMIYDFDMSKGEGVLTRKNLYIPSCCADDLHSNVRVNGDSIIVTEIFESAGTCKKGYCYFDVMTKIKNVQPKVYHIVVVEGAGNYAWDWEFDIDLSKKTRGKCYEE